MIEKGENHFVGMHARNRFSSAVDTALVAAKVET